jgi:CheY-like chemotaxis protein
MDKETQKKIFEPFYTTKFTGRGLGMSAVRGIITSHESLLYLNSAPGVGTSFKVCFPVQKATSYTETASTASTTSNKSTGTVLLIDDEQTLRDMGVRLLNVLCFKSLTASNGQEALEIYREHSTEIDLILLDLVMPVMGGRDAYHELRKLNPTIPIIFCSGYDAESIEDVVNSDIHAVVVTKPYNPAKLKDVIFSMMSNFNNIIQTSTS